MRKTKKVTLSSMMVALSVVVMVLGAVIDVLDLSACAMASLVMVFSYIELGSPYTFLIWICTTVLSAIIFPASMVWMEYLIVFGIYPILKAYIERLPRIFWWPVKLVYINAVIWLLIYFVDLVFGTPFLEGDTVWLRVATYVLINVAFVAYDLFIVVMVRFYYDKIRHRFLRSLK
jgi:hypothetical protein